MSKEKKNKGGRPTKFDVAYVDMAYRMAERGYVDEDIAHVLDVSVATIYNWKSEHPEFLEAIKSGKADYDGQVVKALRHRALGYSHPEEKIFCQDGDIIRAETTKHYPPETAAICYWLNNRQPDKWSNKQHIAVESGHSQLLQEAIAREKACKDIMDGGEDE